MKDARDQKDESRPEFKFWFVKKRKPGHNSGLITHNALEI